MSPLWRSRLIVSLAPNRVSAIKLAGVLSPRPVRNIAVELDGKSSPPWQRPVAALGELLASREWDASAIDIEISSHFVRYVVTPEAPKLRTDSEQTALGQIVFRNSFGGLTQGWTTVFGASKPGLPTIGAAIDPDLLAGIRTAVGKKTRIGSVQPNLSSAFNRICRSITTSDSLVVLIESERISIAHLAKGKWQSVTSRPAITSNAAGVERLIREEIALRSVPESAPTWIRDATGMRDSPQSWHSGQKVIPPRWLDVVAAQYFS